MWHVPSPPILYNDRLSAAGAWRIRWLLPHQHWIAAPITASMSLLSVFVWVLYLASWLSVALEVHLLRHVRLSSVLARAIPQQRLFRPLCLCVFAHKCLTSFCVACSVPASFHIHSKAQQSVLFSQGIRSWCCPGDRLCTCARRCHTTAERSMLGPICYIPLGTCVCKLFIHACFHFGMELESILHSKTWDVRVKLRCHSHICGTWP